MYVERGKFTNNLIITIFIDREVLGVVYEDDQSLKRIQIYKKRNIEYRNIMVSDNRGDNHRVKRVNETDAKW